MLLISGPEHHLRRNLINRHALASGFGYWHAVGPEANAYRLMGRVV